MTQHTNPIQTTTNGHQKNAVLDIGGRAIEAVSTAATAAQAKISKAAGGTEKLVKLYPLKSVGIAIGGGVVLGALAMKFFSHKTTLSEAVHEKLGLKRKIARTIQGWL